MRTEVHVLQHYRKRAYCIIITNRRRPKGLLDSEGRVKGIGLLGCTRRTFLRVVKERFLSMRGMAVAHPISIIVFLNQHCSYSQKLYHFTNLFSLHSLGKGCKGKIRPGCLIVIVLHVQKCAS